MAVFVLDRHHRPLMPCSEKRARLLLAHRRAVVHRRAPFVIRLRDRVRAASTVQEVALKLDPGSKTSGIALVRVEQRQEGGSITPCCWQTSRIEASRSVRRYGSARATVGGAGSPI